MDIKRIIFLFLSTIAFILPFVFTTFIFNDIAAYIFLPIVFYLFYIVFHLFGSLIINTLTGDPLPDFDEYCIFLLGVLLFRQKRIYYSDLGYFYISIKVNSVSVWKQGLLSSRELFKVYYDGNLDDLKDKIKYDLEKIYKKELEEKRRIKTLKDWNGNIDKKSDRDDKLNKILN